MATTKLDELQQKISALQKERDDLLEREREEAIDQINSLIRTYGIKASQLNFGGATRTATFAKAKVPMKYKLGNEAWSGRGRQPKWVADHLAKGGKLDELLVK